MAKLDFKNLSNEEILVIYNKIKEYLDYFNSNLDNDLIAKPLITKNGPTLKIIDLNDNTKQKVLESEYYKSVCSILDKLKPVVDLIEETTPELLIKLNLKKDE